MTPSLRAAANELSGHWALDICHGHWTGVADVITLIIDRPGVAGAVLPTALKFIDLFGDGLSK